MNSYCGYEGSSPNCGCEYHRAWMLLNPGHPDVQEHRARTIAWMRDHPGINPATGRGLAHPDDYLTPIYGAGAEPGELQYLGIVA